MSTTPEAPTDEPGEEPGDESTVTTSEEPAKARRSLPLTIFCCLGFLSFPLYLSQHSNEIQKMREIAVHGESHYQWFFILLVTMMVGYVGLWFMKRYGLWVFCASAVAFGVHNYIGVQNSLAFRDQVIAEDRGEPWEGKHRDTSFLDNPEFIDYVRIEPRGKKVQEASRDPRTAEIEQSTRWLWITLIFNNLRSFFVAFVAILSFRRLR